MQKRRFSVVMSRLEWIGGLLFLPFYLFLLNPGLQRLLRLLSLPVNTLTLNIAFYGVCLCATLLLFHRFLRRSLQAFWRHRWRCLATVPVSLLVYGALAMLTSFLIYRLLPTFQNQNNSAVYQLLEEHRAFTLVLTVAVAPVIEETLFRGLIFGNLRRCSRLLAYLVTAFCFSAIHVFAFAGGLSPLEIGLSMLQYVPATVVFCAVYELTDTIWGPIALHALINLLTCLVWNYIG